MFEPSGNDHVLTMWKTTVSCEAEFKEISNDDRPISSVMNLECSGVRALWEVEKKVIPNDGPDVNID